MSETTTAGSMSASSPAELEAQIERTRDQLAVTIDEIAERVHPRNVAKRTAGRARAVVVDESGQVRTERVLIIGGAAAALIGLVLWRRSRSRAS